MPSAIIKPQENGAPQPAAVQETSIQAAIAVVEKKVRNLEKRKVRKNYKCCEISAIVFTVFH